MFLRKIPVWESIRIATDAMDTAIGAVIEGRTMYKELDPGTAKQNISHKEWLAFKRVILSNSQELRGKVVTWHVDNTNIRFAWLKSGSVRDTWLCKKVVNMQFLLHEQNTLVIPVYVRSAQHLHADLISRNKILPDWHLDPKIARKLFLLFGTPEIDLMATNLSKQVERYYSALVDPEAEGIDSFT